MSKSLTIKTRRDIRTAEWHEEIVEYFGLDEKLLRTAVSLKRLEPEKEPPELKEARETIRKTFMPSVAIQLHDKMLTEHPEYITDVERSNSWKDYIFVCINGEKSSFQRTYFYDLIIKCVVKPMLEWKENLIVLDYGCGSSLFTRILSQDFQGRVKTISADVCRPAVEFSVARNKLYNPNASGMLIEDVLSFPELKEIDLILAYAVFEHLPNTTYQIQMLIDSLSLGGILIENYSGHSSKVPHKSDTFDSYKSRDKNLDLLSNQLTLLYGIMPKRRDGIYGKDSGNRFWIKEGRSTELIAEMRRKLHVQNSFLRKAIRRISKFVNKCYFRESDQS